MVRSDSDLPPYTVHLHLIKILVEQVITACGERHVADIIYYSGCVFHVKIHEIYHRWVVLSNFGIDVDRQWAGQGLISTPAARPRNQVYGKNLVS